MDTHSSDLLETALLASLREKLGSGLSVTLTDNRKSLIAFRRRGEKIELRIARVFSLACADTVEGIVRFVKGESRKLPSIVQRFMDRQIVPRHKVQKAVKGLKSNGNVYDLKEVAAKVNERYFNGEMACRIAWGSNPSRAGKRARSGSIMLGSYDKDLDLVRIHPALDSEFCPEYFVEMVVYHEMLHRKLGTERGATGRRTPHSAKFRAMERQFERYEEAEAWEKANIARILKHRNNLAKSR